MEKNERVVLGIDLGTSGPKVGLINRSGEVKAYEFEPVSLQLFPNGGAEQDPLEWWSAIATATRRLIHKHALGPQSIAGVSCTAQWTGTVAVGRDGKPLMNAVIWMDTRGAPYINQVMQGKVKFEGYGLKKGLTWIRLTGGAPGKAGKDSVAHILYIKNECPEIYKQTYKFLEPKDYLNLVLTGCFASGVDSIAMHYVTDNRDLDRIRYDQRLLDFVGIDAEKLPGLKGTLEILGALKPDIAAEMGLASGIPVVMGTPDFQSAAIGSGAVDDYMGHIYIGTSSWVTCHLPNMKTDPINSLGTLPSALPNRYIVSAEQECAGVCLKFLKNNILFHEDELQTIEKDSDVYEVFNNIAERVPPGSCKVLFTPWLFGERSPVDDHTIRAGFYNLSLETTREQMIRAVFEGVAFNTRWLLVCIEKFVAHQMDVINMIGGGARSDLWCQIHADVLNRTIRQVKKPVLANLRGAGILAWATLGELEFSQVAENTSFSHIYSPEPQNRVIYDSLYKEFINIYKTNQRMYRRLNQDAT